MNIYLGTDMEGASGVTIWEECRRTEPEYKFGRRMITEDVAAAVEGYKAAGAVRIVVSDGHGGGHNFLYDRLPAGAEYVIGKGSAAPLPFLDDSFDAAGMVGQHAMWGAENAFLAHTQNSRTRRSMWANGLRIGEIGQFAIAAGHHGVPVVFLTGDLAATREIEELLGTVETVPIKEASSLTRGLCMAADDARQAIYEGAKRSVALIGEAHPLHVELPLELTIQFNAVEHTHGPVAGGAERVDDLTTRRVVQTAREVYRV